VQISQLLRRKGREVATIDGSESVRTALAVLAEKGIGALVVSSDGRRLDGIIDERDIVRAYVRFGADLAGKSVADLMREEVVSCTPDEPVRQVMSKMTRHRVRHVPVVDGGVIAGIVSIGDVVKSRLEELELEKDVMRDAYMART
jgi:CBS domain-containing protein